MKMELETAGEGYINPEQLARGVWYWGTTNLETKVVVRRVSSDEVVVISETNIRVIPNCHVSRSLREDKIRLRPVPAGSIVSIEV